MKRIEIFIFVTGSLVQTAATFWLDGRLSAVEALVKIQQAEIRLMVDAQANATEIGRFR